MEIYNNNTTDGIEIQPEDVHENNNEADFSFATEYTLSLGGIAIL